MLPVDDHLIGIDADGRVHVSERLLMLHEGPLALGEPEGCRGSVERVAEVRFEQFKRAARWAIRA
jgi:hypothetical protein